MLVFDHTRDRLYVSRALGAAKVPSSLGVFRASDLALLEEPDVFIPRPHALAVDTVTGRVYTGSLGTNQLATFDPERGIAWVTTVTGASHAFVGLATSPDGRRLVATTQLTDRLLAFDTGDPRQLKLLASVPVGTLPYDVAYSPDGRSVWFPNQRVNTVTRVDTRTWTVSAVISHESFVEPHGVVVTADSRTIYISSHGPTAAQSDRTDAGRVPSRGTGADTAAHIMAGQRGNGTVAVIDASTHAVRRVTTVGPYAAALGLSEP
jgi:DNA-binding beta-propeller fold protein YncE